MELLLFLVLLAGLFLLHARQKRVEDHIARIEEQLDLVRSAPAETLPPNVMLDPPPRARLPVVEPESHLAGEGRKQAEADIWSDAPEPEFAPPTFAALFERFVGGRLLIWTGGIALAVAGVFLVRHSIEIGLATPPVRMILAALFGLGLIAAGEIARRRPGFAEEPRIAQALVGAGIFTLYATTYGSHMLYGLISVAMASALMAVITAAALGLALRHGAPTAVMGMIGGFLTPLLVGDPEAGAVPLLVYLALLDAALFALAWRRGWGWLGVAAILLSFAWSGSLLFAPAEDAIAGGVFVAILSIAAIAVQPGASPRRIYPVVIGLAQLALLTARWDSGAAGWILFAILSAASLLLAVRDSERAPLAPLALGFALTLMAIETLAGSDPLIEEAAIGTAILFGGFALGRREPGALWTGVGVAAFVGPLLILRVGAPELLARPAWGLVMALLALAPAWLAWRQRDRADPAEVDPPLLVAGGGVALLLGVAAYDVLPLLWLATGWLAIAAGGAWCARRIGDRALSLIALAIAAAGVARVIASAPELWITAIASIAGKPALLTALPPPLDALPLLAFPGLLLLLAARMVAPLSAGARTALAGAGLLCLLAAAYIGFKQLFGLATPSDFAARGFAERMVLTQLLFLAGWLIWSGHVGERWFGQWRVVVGTGLTALAAARLVWFDLLLHNPGWASQNVGALPLLNLVLPAYGLGAFWLFEARRRSQGAARSIWLLLFLAVLTTGAMLMVRQLFQGAILNGPDVPRGEFYGYSLAGLLLAISLFVAGLKRADEPLRVAGLALLTATVLKVFLIDAGALEGMLRILSFLGLGIALIGVGKLYGAVLGGRRAIAD